MRLFCRELLAFMEPPAWAKTSHAVAGLTKAQLAEFPLPQFLDAYMFHTLEVLEQYQQQIRAAETRTAVADKALLAHLESAAGSSPAKK
jgi:hypothetical protein